MGEGRIARAIKYTFRVDCALDIRPRKVYGKGVRDLRSAVFLRLLIKLLYNLPLGNLSTFQYIMQSITPNLPKLCLFQVNWVWNTIKFLNIRVFGIVSFPVHCVGSRI